MKYGVREVKVKRSCWERYFCFIRKRRRKREEEKKRENDRKNDIREGK